MAAPVVYAPPMVTSNDTCAGSFSAGGGGGSDRSLFSVVLGLVFPMDGCERRADSNQAVRLGMTEVAVERMCDGDKFRAAALRAGQPCASDRQRAEPVAYRTQPQLVMTPNTAADPTASASKCQSVLGARPRTQFQVDYLRANCGLH